MATDSKHIDLLITRYLSGEATKDEKQHLESWLGQSEQNKKYFDGFRFVHEKAYLSNHIEKVDVDKAWNQLHAQMSAKAIEKKFSVARLPIYQSLWFRIAALFVVVFGLSFWLYVHFQSSRDNELKAIALVSQNHTTSYTLKDSSSVVLNQKSKITYTRGYGKKQRELNLSGEAYFKVKHDAGKPFVVKAEETCVKDIGTTFNMKAYSESTTIEVYVESGEVKFYTASNPGIVLTKGETGVYDKALKSFKKTRVSDSNVVSYQSKVFVFQDTRLTDAIERLNMVYQANIKLDNEELKNCRITVTFDKEDISSIINIIAETLKLEAIKTSDGYLLKGKACTAR